MQVSTQNLAKSLDSNLCNLLDKIEVGMAATGREAERQLAGGGIRPGELDAYISRQLSLLPEIHALRVADADGNVRWGSGSPAGTQVNVADREYFRRLRSDPKARFVVSELLQGRISGRWGIIIAERVSRPDGSFGGAVLGSVDVDSVDGLISKLDVGPLGAVGVRDLTFKLVALRPKGPEPGSRIGSDVVSQKT